jgi:hypothetical protein
MKRNILNTVPVFFFFVFSFFSLSADNVNWITPVSDADFLGRWESRFSMDIPQFPGIAMPRTGVDVAFNLEYTKPAAGGMFLYNMVFDMERFLDALLSVPEMKMLGMTKDTVWDLMLSDADFSDGEFSEYDVVIKRYYISVTQTETAEEFFEDSSKGEVFISEDRRQMKLVFFEPVTLGLGDAGFSEVILHKR